MKLTDEQIDAILREYQPGVIGKGYKALAVKYGVTKAYIQAIINGRSKRAKQRKILMGRSDSSDG